jgi:hypothetical protein
MSSFYVEAVRWLTIGIFALALFVKLVGTFAPGVMPANVSPSSMVGFVLAVFVDVVVVAGLAARVIGRLPMCFVLAALVGFNVHELVQGADRCQCFGGLSVGVPVVLALDLLLLVLWLAVRSEASRWTALGAALILSGVVGAGTSSGLRLLEPPIAPIESPDSLIGRAPQFAGMDVAGNASELPNTIILIRSSCDSCKSMLHRLEAASPSSGFMVYVVSDDLPPVDQVDRLARSGVFVRHADKQMRRRYASVSSPLVFEIKDDVVVRISHSLQ